MSRRGWVLFLAMGVIWGVPYLFIKVAVESLTPASLVFLRTTVAALLQMAVVAIGYAVGPFILARYLSELPGLGVVAGSLVLTTAAYVAPGVAQLPRHWPPAEAIAAVLVLAVLCTAVAFLLFFALIDEVGPVRATVITYINPAVAVALGVALLGEPLTVGIGIGFALILIGSVLATRRSPPVVVCEP